MKEPLAQSTVAVRYGFNHKIKTECAYQNKAIPVFLSSTAALCVLSLLYLDVDWIKLAGRVPDMGSIFYRLAQFDFKYMDLIAAAMWETLSITVLSTLYSVILGFVFWHVCGRKYFPYALAVGIGAVMVYLFACRTDAVWVLLMMVCLGMGPAAGIAGLCVHTTAFFTRAFAQSFESIPQETIEALEATGVGRIGVFFNAVLPAALSQLVAWIAMRFEINFRNVPFWA